MNGERIEVAPVVTPVPRRKWYARFFTHPAIVLVEVMLLAGIAGMGLRFALVALGAFAWAEARGIHAVVLVGQVPQTLATLVVVALIARFVERRRVTELAGPAPVALRDLGVGFAGGAAMLMATVGMLAAAGWYRIDRIELELDAFLFALGGFLLVGVFEELFFRGVAFRLLEDWLGSWAALALSAALFGWVHISNDNATWISSVGIAVEAGLLLGAVYMLTRTLWAVIGVHWAWNFFEGPVFGTPVSGHDFDTWIRSTTSGPELLSGGDFGPEASLPMMVLGTSISIALLVIAHRRGQVIAPRWVRRRRAATASVTASAPSAHRPA